MQTVIPAELPPFVLTEEQRAKLDLCRSDDSRTMFLQVWHHAHCYRHRNVVGVFGSLDPARFSREWEARQAEFLTDAWEAYLDQSDIEASLAMPAMGYVPGGVA